MDNFCDAVHNGDSEIAPDKEDGLCVASLFDWSAPDRALTKRNLINRMHEPGTTGNQILALVRVSSHLDDVGHVIGSHFENGTPTLFSTGDFMLSIPNTYRVYDFGISHSELEKIGDKK